MIELELRTTARKEMIPITREVQQALTALGAGDGICHVHVPHTTAAVVVNENADPTVRRDMLAALDRIVPWRGNYEHAEGNPAAHIKASLMGPSHYIPVACGHLRLGTWQGIYLCEHRNRGGQRRLVATLQGESA